MKGGSGAILNIDDLAAGEGEFLSVTSCAGPNKTRKNGGNQDRPIHYIGQPPPINVSRILLINIPPCGVPGHNRAVSILSYVFAFLAGSASPVQAGASSQLNKGIASPIWAALFVYATGLAGVLLVQLIVRQAWPGQRFFGALPWWVWTGGIISIASTLSGLILAQKMGSGMFTGLSLTASLLTSIVLDQFGLMGFKPHPVSSLRLTGAGLMVTGIWLIAKF
jgi:transporter family-2 protein